VRVGALVGGPDRSARFLPLALGFLTTGLATAMASPFLALFLDRAVRTTPVQTTVFLAAAPLAAVVVSSMIGRLSDRLPTRGGLLAAAALAGCAGAAVTAVVRDYLVLLLVSVTLTAAASGTMPQLFASAREAFGNSARVALRMSSLRSVFSAAWVAGPPSSAALLQLGGFRVVFAATSAMYAITASTALVALRSRRPAVVPAADDVDDDAGPDAPRSTLWLTVAAFVLITAATVLAVQSLSLFLTTELGVGVDAAGWLLGLCAGLEIPLMLGLGVLSTRVPITRLLLIGAALGIVYRVLVAVSQSVWLPAVGQLLNAATIAAFAGLGVVHLQDLLPRHTGRASTLFSNTYPAGSALAGPVIGLAQASGYRMPYMVGAGLCALAFVLLLLAGPRVREPQDAVT
jgi:SET family sugar efflux transporter-like MFS transporter